MIDDDPEQGTYQGLFRPTERRTTLRALGPALPWLIAAVVLLVVAAVGGLGTAYLVATLRAAPPPDPAFLPSPTPLVTASPSPTAEESPTPSAAAPATPSPSPEPATPSPEPTAEPSPFVHVVERGDTISKIAARYGVTPDSIIALNELRNPNRIVPGQRLLIPPPAPSPAP